MQLSLFALATAVTAMVMSAAPAQAFDYRVEVKHPSQSGTGFCKDWHSSCINYQPKDKDLTFQGEVCEPGDYHGKHTKTLAKAYCAFKNGTATTLVTHHVAKEVGATIVPTS